MPCSSFFVFTATSFYIAQYVGIILTFTCYGLSTVFATSALASKSGSVPALVLDFISATVARNLLTSAFACTWSSVFLSFLATTSASLTASVLSYGLTSTSLRVLPHVFFSLLAIMYASSSTTAMA